MKEFGLSSRHAKHFYSVVKAIDLIENNIGSPVSLEDVTQVISESHWQTQRIFRSVVGISIGQYIRERRLTEAGIVLRNSNARILDVALDFQYQSHESFTRAFKGFYGDNPGDWRASERNIATQLRNRITEEKLAYFWEKIQREPAILTLDEKKMVGRNINFRSHFIPGFDCKSKLVPHWAGFISEIPNIPHRSSKNGYGVVIGDDLQISTENLAYISAIEVSKFSEEHQSFEQYTVPAGTFASFENYNTQDYTGNLLDFIYGIWLPTSGYSRAKNVDLEIFSPTYRLEDKHARSHYLIPISPL